MIKFVYFDLGGVVIKDFSGTNKWEQFTKDFDVTDEYWDKHEPEMNRGHFPVEEAFISAFAERFEKNESIWPVVELARKKFKIGLLTNMYTGLLRAIKDKGLLPKVSWDVIVDSSVEGYEKPEEKIFQIAAERSGVKKNEILFIENTQSYVKTATDFGFQTYWYDSKDYEQSSKNLLEYLEHEFKE